MPCDTISQVGVAFGPNTDKKLIHAALQDMGLSPVETGSYINFNTGSYNTKTNEFTFRGASGQRHADEIKQAYSAAVVRSQAQRFGWTLKAGKEKYQYTVSKRSI